MRFNKFRSILLIIVFITILLFPFLNYNFGIIKDIESHENRGLNKKPAFEIRKLDAFTVKYENYYNDNFSLRYLFIKKFNHYNLKFFDISPIPYQVIIGKNGWLFLGSEELNVYKGTDGFTDKELSDIKSELEYRAKYLKERNCQYYFMIVPMRSSIYSEFFPRYIERVSSISVGEKLNSFLKTNSVIKIIDLYKPLRDKKDNEHIYHKLDHHWNELGAFYAANEFFNYLSKDFPKIKELSLDSFDVRKIRTRKGGITKMLNDTTIFEDDIIKLIPKSGYHSTSAPKKNYPVIQGFPYSWEYELSNVTNDTTKPNLLVISDSFGGDIFLFLAERFNRTVKIFDAWQHKLNEDIVNNEKPDIFLQMVNESQLRKILEYKSERK